MKKIISTLLALVFTLLLTFASKSDVASELDSTAVSSSEDELTLANVASKEELITQTQVGLSYVEIGECCSEDVCTMPTPSPTASQLKLADVDCVFAVSTYDISETELYEYSFEEKEYIARVVYAEARGEIFEGQVAVAAVIINRFESGLYGDTVRSVIMAPNQFVVASQYNDEVMQAVETAIECRGDYPSNMYYFQVSKSKTWYDFEYYTRIGNHSFYCSAS